MDGPLVRAVIALSASKVAASSSEALKKVSPRMRVDIEAVCPLIVFPRTDRVSEALALVDLGNVSVKTDFEQDTAVHTLLIAHMNIAAGADTSLVKQVLQDMNIKVSIAQVCNLYRNECIADISATGCWCCCLR